MHIQDLLKVLQKARAFENAALKLRQNAHTRFPDGLRHSHMKLHVFQLFT